ncbi:MAG: hypothetical protein ACKVPX_09125 [Myxococcaceae bacterium]
MSEIAAKRGRTEMRSYSAAERRRDELESAWLAENRDRYVGLWIALQGDELLAAAPTAREVFAAVAGRSATALVMQIESPAPFAGW